jgi:hypothetical protein
MNQSLVVGCWPRTKGEQPTTGPRTGRVLSGYFSAIVSTR